MTTPLLAWLRRSSPVRGVRFSQPDGWRLWPYDELAHLVRRTGAALVSAGVRPNDVVVVAQGTGPGFVGTLFGTLLAGGVASPVTPPTAFRDPGDYAAHLTRVLETARPALVVYDAPSVGALAARVGVPAIGVQSLLELAGGADRTPARPPSPTALLQFTSGTSGSARAVRIPLAALERNIAGIQSWLAMTPEDPTASWLPPHHDMGLVGCLLSPVVTGADLWLMSPAEFVRRPLRYLSCFGQHGARLTAMPPFGLDHLVRRVRPDDLTAMDFRDWRAVIVGAERIWPACLERFAAL
ncbi:MAG: AMP-binding protein, partial [Micromonosporaceae bacterium]